MKRYFLIILSLFLTLTFASCSSTTSNKGMAKPPEISIKTGDKEIGYVVGLNKWNSAIYDREDTFHTILKEGSSIKVPYIKLGETIEIIFKGTPPDKIELKDYILKENSDVRYTEKEVKEIPIKLLNGKATFKLEPHMAALLSSDFTDYEKGKVIRGFKLTCSWSDNECEYGFIIKTDVSQ